MSVSMQKNQDSCALQICHSYKPPFGNIASVYSEFFRESGCRLVTVFLTGDKPTDGSVNIYGEAVFLGHNSSELSGLKLKVLRDLIDICRSHPFDFIIGHRYKSIYLGCLLSLFRGGMDVYGVVHSAKTFKRFFRKRFVSIFKKRLVILPVSKSLASEVRQSLPAYPRFRIRHFYNRIDMQTIEQSLLSRKSARKALSIDPNAFVYGNVARLHRKKNQECLIRAFSVVQKLVPDAQLVLIGDGDLEVELKKLVEQLGIKNKVHFMGFVANAEIYFRAFDVFVLSSQVETFGLVLLEAMVAGVPVIGSNAGGIPEVISSVGEIFPSRNVDALAKAMHKKYQYSVEKSTNYEECRKYAEEKFSLTAGRRDFWKMRNLDQAR